jgi:hypothetical protein
MLKAERERQLTCYTAPRSPGASRTPGPWDLPHRGSLDGPRGRPCRLLMIYAIIRPEPLAIFHVPTDF